MAVQDEHRSTVNFFSPQITDLVWVTCSMQFLCYNQYPSALANNVYRLGKGWLLPSLLFHPYADRHNPCFSLMRKCKNLYFDQEKPHGVIFFFHISQYKRKTDFSLVTGRFFKNILTFINRSRCINVIIMCSLKLHLEYTSFFFNQHFEIGPHKHTDCSRIFPYLGVP